MQAKREGNIILNIVLAIAGVLIISGAYLILTNKANPAPVSGELGTIQGSLHLGPTCPVQRIPPDPNCADKPYKTLVAIFKASDPVHAVVLTNSNASGTFSASLPPGDYTIGAGESNLPRCAAVNASVVADKVVSVDIYCDTGIR